MKVLFATINDGSFLDPMVPLAWAMRTAGHDVRVACQSFAVPHVLAAGLTAVPVGRQARSDRLLTAMQVTPEMLEAARPGLHPPYDLVDCGADCDDACGHTRSLTDLIAGYTEDTERVRYENFPMISGLVGFARDWQPDLIVWEPFTPAGAIAAKACGAAHARILFGIDAFGAARARFLRLRTADSPDPLRALLGSYARKFGDEFSEDMTCGQVTIDHYPRSLQLEADSLTYLHMRYVPYGGRAEIPAWLQTTPDRPRVALTMGMTASGFFDGFPFGLQEALDELGRMDVEVVAILDASERERLQRIPPNARIEQWVPLDALAATCSAAITHAGGGTMSTFVARGVPQLTLPYHFDEPALGRRLAGTSAGICLDPRRADGQAVASSVERLLEDPRIVSGARRLAEEVATLPTPNEVADLLLRAAV